MGINLTDYNIVKMQYCEDRTIAFLHYKDDGYYYVTIIVLQEQRAVYEIKLPLTYTNTGLQAFVLQGWCSMHNPNISPIEKYYHVNDDILRTFRQVEDLVFFEIDTANNTIILYAKTNIFGFKNSEFVEMESDAEVGYFVEVYNFNGVLLTSHKLTADIFYIETAAFKCDSKIFITYDNGDKLLVWDLSTHETVFRGIIIPYIISGKGVMGEWLYGHIYANRQDCIAYIADDPTHGGFGVKVIQLLPDSSLQIVFDQNEFDMEYGFQNLAFRYDGERLAVLWMTPHENIKILEYSLSDSKMPVRTITTPYTSREESIFNCRYFSENKICMATENKLILYDLEHQTVNEFLRDNMSPFIVRQRQLFYFYNNELTEYSEAF
jgi:hypothetical protein